MRWSRRRRLSVAPVHLKLPACLLLPPPPSQAFGPGGLGICTVSGVPGFVEGRAALLPLAAAFARLPADVQVGAGWREGRACVLRLVFPSRGSATLTPVCVFFCPSVLA